MKFNAPKILQRPTLLIAALLIAASASGFFASRMPTASKRKPYLAGQTAGTEIVAPKKFAVIDLVETEVRRQMKLAKAPVIFRFQKDVADKSVAGLSTEFIFSREKFLDVVEKNFKKRTLATNQIAGPRFRKMFNTFRAAHKIFPVNFQQASKWAQGEAEEELQKKLRAQLRKSTDKFIRVDALPSFTRSNQFRILDDGLVGTSPELLKRSQFLRRTNLVSLTKARNELLNSFPRSERAFAKALTNFVAPNTVFDEKLTAQIRFEKTNELWAVASYEPGQLIVGQGKIIDAKAKAALDELKIFAPVFEANFNRRMWLWITAISCAVFALVVWLLSFAFRPRTALVRAENVLVLPTGGLNESLQARLMPHLARGLMNKLVRGLISQRSDLIQAQNAGTEQLNELEEQLEQVTTRLHTRQMAYEKRIAELERELAAAEEENRELIRAKIHEARQNLEWAKAQNQRG